METDLTAEVLRLATPALEALAVLPDEQRLGAINALRLAIHKLSPMAAEPIDCVQWVPAERVSANDYNPNVVAPPELALLEISIAADGYTQPIVVWDTGVEYEVVDGFHRTRVGKENEGISARLHGMLPVTVIRADREDRNDRIAATIRHNRARGKHQVAQMAEIVQELSRRNWSKERIARELGMEPDEVLRLKQITGLAELFANEEFSQAWDGI